MDIVKGLVSRVSPTRWGYPRRISSPLGLHYKVDGGGGGGGQYSVGEARNRIFFPGLAAHPRKGKCNDYKGSSYCWQYEDNEGEFFKMWGLQGTRIPVTVIGGKGETKREAHQMGTLYTSKTQYQKFETIPRKGIVRPQSQFPHSCVC
jgi:hypothetical protein